MEYDYEKVHAAIRWDRYSHFHKPLWGRPYTVFSTGELIITNHRPGPAPREMVAQSKVPGALSGISLELTATSPGDFYLNDEKIPRTWVTQGGGQYLVVDHDTHLCTQLAAPHELDRKKLPVHLRDAAAYALSPEAGFQGLPVVVSQPDKDMAKRWQAVHEVATRTAKGLAAINQDAPWISKWHGPESPHTMAARSGILSEYGALIEELLADPAARVVSLFDEVMAQDNTRYYTPTLPLMRRQVMQALIRGDLMNNVRKVFNTDELKYKPPGVK